MGYNPAAMARFTPFHPRTGPLATSLAYKEWAGYNAVCTFDRHSEREYFAIRNTAGLLDVTPLHKYEVTGPDAAALLARVFTRDIRRIGVGTVVYSAMCDEYGKMLDDGTVARLSKDHYRMTSSERWLWWLQRHARGLTVEIEDSTDRICALALQGPNARKILTSVVAFDMDKMRFFRVRRTTLAGVDVEISRTGYTGDLGFEIWMDNSNALPVWDALIAAGEMYGIEPIGLDALDVSRIEAGFVLQGIDYTTAVRCLLESQKSTPMEAGLGWTVDLERDAFVGQAALLAEQQSGPAWDLVGIEIDWGELEALYGRYGIPPHLAPVACRSPLPLYDVRGRHIGQATSNTWSPMLKRFIALAQVQKPFAELGTTLQIEHTVEYERHRISARVVERPFFDPERKRSTPGRTKKGSS